VLDEQRVEGDPVGARHHARERPLRRFGRPRADDAEAVRDPVHVGVDRDRRDPVPEHEHAVRRLRADVRQAHERLKVPGDLAAEPVEERLGARPHAPGLHAVEPGRPDERLDRLGPGPRERAGIRVPREQAGARDVGVRVPGPLGEDRADQDLERVFRVVPEVRGPPVAGPIEGRQAVEDRLPRERYRRGPPHDCRPPTAGTDSVPGSERSGSSGAAPSRRTSSPMR